MTLNSVLNFLVVFTLGAGVLLADARADFQPIRLTCDLNKLSGFRTMIATRIHKDAAQACIGQVDLNDDQIQDFLLFYNSSEFCNEDQCHLHGWLLNGNEWSKVLETKTLIDGVSTGGVFNNMQTLQIKFYAPCHKTQTCPTLTLNNNSQYLENINSSIYVYDKQARKYRQVGAN